MPCTQYDDQDRNHNQNRRGSFRPTFSRAFVSLRLTNSQYQNMPSFAIVSPSIDQDQQGLSTHHHYPQRSDYQHQHHRQHRLSHEMHQIAQAPVQVIPRAIINVADDLTEQIRISVQDTHISPRAYLNEVSTGGNLSDVHDNYDNTESYQSASLSHEPDEGEQDIYIQQSSAQANVNSTHHMNESNTHTDQSGRHYSDRHSVTTLNEALTDSSNSSAQTAVTGLTSEQSASTSQQFIIQPSNGSERSQSNCSSTNESFVPNSSSGVAQSRRLVELLRLCSNKGPSESRSTTSKSTISRIPIAKPSHTSQITAKTCKNELKSQSPIQESKQEKTTEAKSQANGTQQIDSNKPFEKQQVDNQLCNHSPNHIDVVSLSLLGVSPPYSSHRQAGFIKSNLYNGSNFSGFQKSKKESYEVNVRIQYIDPGSSYLCGYLCINHMIQSHPSLTTFFEGEIISEKYPFLTQKWDANETIDRAHWSKLGDLKNRFGQNYLDNNFDYKSLNNSDYIYMRWKEHFLVPDHTIEQVEGASYAGFYYICYSKRTSQIRGYYFHISENFESFQSLNLEYEHENSSQVYEFR